MSSHLNDFMEKNKKLSIATATILWRKTISKFSQLHRVSYMYMSARIIEFIKQVGEKIRCEALPSILSVSPNKFDKFSNTGA